MLELLKTAKYSLAGWFFFGCMCSTNIAEVAIIAGILGVGCFLKALLGDK